jgi:putative glutamine amidotransferase
VALPAPYVQALQRAGAQDAVLTPAPLSDAEAASLLERFDGLLLAGGGDLDPSLYDQPCHDEVYGVDPRRDHFELALARTLTRTAVPTLAICRGAQVLNVALGGTLDQHITDRPGLVAHGVPGEVGGAAMHPVTVTAGSRLAGALGTTRPDCSSHHHQAIDRLGDGLRVVARADDGVVEGVELAGDTWIVAAQWHPEETAASDPTQQSLFDAFVAEAARHRAEMRA